MSKRLALWTFGKGEHPSCQHAAGISNPSLQHGLWVLQSWTGRSVSFIFLRFTSSGSGNTENVKVNENQTFFFFVFVLTDPFESLYQSAGERLIMLNCSNGADCGHIAAHS